MEIKLSDNNMFIITQLVSNKVGTGVVRTFYLSFVSYALYSELLCILTELKLTSAFLLTVRSDAVLRIIQLC